MISKHCSRMDFVRDAISISSVILASGDTTARLICPEDIAFSKRFMLKNDVLNRPIRAMVDRIKLSLSSPDQLECFIAYSFSLILLYCSQLQNPSTFTVFVSFVRIFEICLFSSSVSLFGDLTSWRDPDSSSFVQANIFADSNCSIANSHDSGLNGATT